MRPVQTALIPELAALPLVPFAQERLNDYLVSAPTGSGKTLAYAVPIVKVSMGFAYDQSEKNALIDRVDYNYRY
jgi:superfamily II DNA/RNA helicase